MKIVIVTHRGQIETIYADTLDDLSIEEVDDSWRIGNSPEIKPLSEFPEELREFIGRRIHRKTDEE